MEPWSFVLEELRQCRQQLDQLTAIVESLQRRRVEQTESWGPTADFDAPSYAVRQSEFLPYGRDWSRVPSHR